MPVVKIQIVLLKITSEFVHVNQAQRVIHFLGVFQFNIVALIINVHRERFVRLAFVAQFVHRIVNALTINYVYKVFVSRPVMITQRVLTSNFVKITFVHKRFDAVAMMIVCSVNVVLSIRTVVRNVRMPVKGEFFVVEMRNVCHVITMHCVHVNKDSLMMDKVVAEESNVLVMLNVVQIISVKRIFVNWPAKRENHAVKKPFAQQKIIDQFVTVNQDIAGIRINIVMQLIIAETHLVAQEHFVRIIKEHSIVPVEMVMLEMLIMKVADWHLNVKTMEIVHQVLNAFNRIVNLNAEMCVNELVADQMPNVFLLIMWLSVNAYRAIVAKQQT